MGPLSIALIHIHEQLGERFRNRGQQARRVRRSDAPDDPELLGAHVPLQFQRALAALKQLVHQRRISPLAGSASYARVFQPSLIGQSVVVLSSNDRACIARSNEAKDLSAKMSQPWFEVRHLERSAGLIARSANFKLYGGIGSPTLYWDKYANRGSSALLEWRRLELADST